MYEVTYRLRKEVKQWNHGTDATKRFEEIKNEFENTGKYMNTVGYNAIGDLIQMVDLLIKRNSIENGNLKELKIFLKDERILIIKTNRIITDKETLKCFDIERKLWFTFNFNEIIYYTIEKVGE